MQRRSLGNTGIDVSTLGVGLWGMGGWSGSDDSRSEEVLRLAAAAGCSFFDSAWAYGGGHADRLLGKLVHAVGSGRVTVAAKVPPKNLRWPASPSDSIEDVFPMDHVLEYTEQMRASIGVDCIDVLQYHVWDDSWASSATFERTVRRLRDSKLIRAFGISLNRWEPTNGLAAVRTGLIDCVQVIYNIFDQAPEDVLFPECQARGVAVIARVPLDEGSLGGTFTLETRFPADDWRAKYFGPENLPETVRRVEALRRDLPGSSLPEVALRFAMSHPAVSTTIVGMRTRGHLEHNVHAAELGPLDGTTIDLLRNHRWDRAVTPWAN